MQMAQGGSASAIDPSIESTIWPNNTYSALPTPIAQMHSNGETMGMDGGNIMSDLPQMDGTGLGFAFDDMNWENSLLMPVSLLSTLARDTADAKRLTGFRQFRATGS